MTSREGSSSPSSLTTRRATGSARCRAAWRRSTKAQRFFAAPRAPGVKPHRPAVGALSRAAAGRRHPAGVGSALSGVRLDARRARPPKSGTRDAKAAQAAIDAARRRQRPRARRGVTSRRSRTTPATPQAAGAASSRSRTPCSSPPSASARTEAPRHGATDRRAGTSTRRSTTGRTRRPSRAATCAFWRRLAAAQTVRSSSSAAAPAGSRSRSCAPACRWSASIARSRCSPARGSGCAAPS